jgi:DNA repair exonuclease SbcCD nuclease subunit
MFKFIHAADIHLDSAREGVQRDLEGPVVEIQQAPRRAFENLVSLAIDEEVAFVLIAGDLYDGNWPDFHTGLFFLEQAAKLNRAGIRIFLVAGNHDAANVMTRTLMLPSGDKIKMFDAKSPETVVLEDLQIAIHGQSFRNRAVTDDLAQGFPAGKTGMFNIGLLHTSATFAAGEHDCYAPCSIETMLSKRYDYWALGHIHKRQDLRRSKDEPPMMFPGNLQGRHIRETGPKGCVLVTVEDSHNTDVQFRPLDVLRWQRSRVNVEGIETPQEIVQSVADHLSRLLEESDNRPLAVRVELEGACPAHRQLVAEPNRWDAEIQAATLQLGTDRVWIERVVRSTSPPVTDTEQEASEGPVAELCEFIQEMRDDEESLEMLVEALQPLRSKLPTELTEGERSLELDDSRRLQALLDDAQQLLIERIHGRGDQL